MFLTDIIWEHLDIYFLSIQFFSVNNHDDKSVIYVLLVFFFILLMWKEYLPTAFLIFHKGYEMVQY